MKRNVLATLATLAAVAVLSLGLAIASPAPAGADTTLSLTVTASPVTFGNETSLVFSASINDVFAGGKVTIQTGTTKICSFTLSQNAGQCSPTSDTLLAPSASPYSVVATYPGDAVVPALMSSSSPLTVEQQDTTTTLSISPPSPVTYGQESTLIFTAGVTPQISGTPTGTIEVDAGPTVLCSISLPDTTCSTSDDPLSASGTPYSVTATYLGDTNDATSTSSTQSLTVDQASTTLALSVAPLTVAFGDESTLQIGATVTPEFGATPFGIVTVSVGGTTLCTITLPAAACPPLGGDALDVSGSPYELTATYPGDTNFTGSTSNSHQLTVIPGNSTTSLTISPLSSAKYGNESTVTFGGSVSSMQSGTPMGTITVLAGTTPLCSFDLSQATSCQTTDTKLAASGSAYGVVASYSGDGNFTPSASDPQDFTVNQASTTASLPALSPVTYGHEDSITFSPTVVPEFGGTPTGTVTIATGTTTLCTFSLPSGTGCSTSTTKLPVSGSPYPVTARYGGDTNFTTSTSDPQDLTVTRASTMTSLSISPTTVTYGDELSVQFDVAVSPEFTGAPTGLVSVQTGSNVLCTFILASADNGSGSCNPTSDTLLAASPSPYPVTAVYAGDANFTGSSSSPAKDLMVVAATSSTGLSLSSPSAIYGDEQSEAFTVTVTPGQPGTPTGPVTVWTGSKVLCTFILASADHGSGSCSPTSGSLLGASTSPYPVTAVYAGDSIYAPSTSDPSQNFTVTKAGTGTGLMLSRSSVTYGGESAVTFSTTLTPAFPGTPTHSISVAAGSTPLCTITLPATSCTTGPTALGAGGYTISATYSGDQNFLSSTGTNTLTVDQATPTTPSIANLPSGAAEEGGFSASIATSGDGFRTVASQTPDTCAVGSDGVTVSFLVAGTCTLIPQVSNGHNFTGATGSPQTFSIAFGPRGYWLVGSDGGIFSFGSAQFYGSMGGTPLQRPVVGITPTHTKHGYWLVASDGGIFSFGDSNFFGSIPGLGLHPAGSGQPNSLAAPIVGMVPSSTGNGYFMVASDGGVFAFGDARFAGSCPGIGGCAGSAVAVMPDHSGNGYWLVTSVGAIYAFGDAPFFGAPSGQGSPVVNAVATPDGRGYWILYANGTVLNFGDAFGLGAPVGFVNQFNPATSIFPTTDGLGYWVASARGDVFTFGNAPFLGSMSATPLNGPIIAAFGF